MRKNARAKACDIPQKVKQEVWERDSGRCVWCGATVNVMPNAHVVSRAQGGLGIAENVVTLCTQFGNGCHYSFDNGTAEVKEAMYESIENYLKSFYPDWNKDDLIYRKYNWYW